MSFIKEYAQKLVTAEEAVKVVKSHDWVDLVGQQVHQLP